MRTIFIIISWIAVAVFAAYLAGVRVIVIQPLKGMPSGGTAIVWGISGYRLIDSPDAKCRRDEGAENIYCRIAVMKDVAENGKVLFRLPYSGFLEQVSDW
ncbi:hypothetical protein [Ochrobactrum sp. S1502_03]|uniref:hypothetical protein n=1 Tax=Ochrobactrum sp. S1502_03 TaxID=3108451 RepID=UPI0037C7562A